MKESEYKAMQNKTTQKQKNPCFLIAPDSFKGSLTSLQVIDIITKAASLHFPEAEFIRLPIADGGEGTVDAIITALGGEFRTAKVKDPLGRPITAKYGIIESSNSGDPSIKKQTAVIEMAQASGLTLLHKNEYNPLKTTSYGTGELILHALDEGVRNFIIGIGGSATNDAGIGAAQALGLSFRSDNTLNSKLHKSLYNKPHKKPDICPENKPNKNPDNSPDNDSHNNPDNDTDNDSHNNLGNNQYKNPHNYPYKSTHISPHSNPNINPAASPEIDGLGGENLLNIDTICSAGIDKRALASEFTIICDVKNPMTGSYGATLVYGPQKGGSKKALNTLETGMIHYENLLHKYTGLEIGKIPGTGAAGGFAATFTAFFNATLKPGIDTILDIAGFDSLLDRTDLVITGEGHIDGQTLFGKVPAGIAKRCSLKGVKVVAVCGGSGYDADNVYSSGIASIMPAISRPMTLDEAIENAPVLLFKAADRMFRFIALGMHVKKC